MKRLFLHIGRHKCGTTSIQKSLYQNRDRLLEAGFYYPETGIRVAAHHKLAEALGERKRSTSEEVRTELYATLKDEIRRTPCNNIIISSEGFQSCNPLEIARVFQDYEIVPVCYLREQAAYLRSAYLQKVHATDYSAPIETFYRGFFSADYRVFLEKWKAVFSEDFHIRVFDRESLIDGDAVRDFLFAILGLGNDEVESLEILNDENPSISREMLAFKLEFNLRGLPNNGRTYFGLAKLSKGHGSKYEIPMAISQEVRAKYSESNRWLEKNLFTDGQRFSYPLFEGEPPEPISPEDFDAIYELLTTM